MKRFLQLILCFGLPALIASASETLSYNEALRDSILARITGAVMPDGTPEVDIRSLGARPDGVHDCLPAFVKAMKRAERRGGLHIRVPEGTYYLCGPLRLTDNVTIRLDSGATLRFSPDPEHYPVVETSWEGTPLYNISPMIYARSCRNVAITGRGTIDGNAASTFATWRPLQGAAQKLSRRMNHERTPLADRHFSAADHLRPHLMQFYGCEGVTLEGVRIVNSPFWCVHLLESSNVVCRSLRYDAKLVNNDGIDPESSRDILIEDVDFDNGDDNIAIKSGRDHDGRLTASPCSNIVIRRCRFKGLHAVVLGSEMSGGVSNVFVEDCTAGGYCKRGIYVKTNPDRGGYVRGLYVRNCTFDAVEDLFYVTTSYAGQGLDNTFYPEIDGIVVDGLRCRSAAKGALILQGLPQKPIRRVSLSGVTVDEAPASVCITHAPDVSLCDCRIGPSDDVPTQVTDSDRIFR